MQDRTGFIGGSDAKRILDGDWHSLYLEKIGETQGDDLSHKFNVQLGVYTESFHVNWLNKYHGFDIEPCISPIHMDGQPVIRAQFDGWCNTHDTFVEVKHSNSFATIDTMMEWYQPQLAHYCNVAHRSHGWLSFIAGNEEPKFVKVAPSQQYRDELIEHELRFWWHVENKVPPEIIPKGSLARTVALAARVMLDDMRAVDMTGNNQWADMAVDYIVHKESAARFESAKKTLKELVADDVREATGHGLKIKRNKAGSLLFTVIKPEAAA